MCEYCEGVKYIIKNNDEEIIIEENNILRIDFFTGDACFDSGMSLKINFCPMCGRKLA
jgi:hypothetical protein